MTKEKTKEKARNKSLFNRFLDVVEPVSYTHLTLPTN